MSNVFFTADLHLGHKRVAGIRGFWDEDNVTDTEDGPVCAPDTDAHDQMIVDVWESMIGPRDIVFVLGDIAVTDTDQALSILASLPGQKHLIAGNHDPVHPMHTRGFARHFRAFSQVFETVSSVRSRKINGTKVMMSHFPFASWGDGEGREGSRHDEWRVPDLGQPLLHGHTHGQERQHDNMFHVGWDAWGQPVPESWIAAWLHGRSAL